jgi:hypothetical protein
MHTRSSGQGRSSFLRINRRVFLSAEAEREVFRVAEDQLLPFRGEPRDSFREHLGSGRAHWILTSVVVRPEGPSRAGYSSLPRVSPPLRGPR